MRICIELLQAWNFVWQFYMSKACNDKKPILATSNESEHYWIKYLHKGKGKVKMSYSQKKIGETY